MTTCPIRLSIHALGGQGGGVLADWLVALAESEGWTAQATSVPGVAQRTGATLYYLELAPPMDGAPPVMALMPTPGDVDIVIAAELMEAGRAIARGLVTPDRTVLIASSHRIFSIGEKSALGDGIFSPSRVLEAATTASARLVLADFAAIAERNGAALSAVLFGAVAAAGVLPFGRPAFEAAIRTSGKTVKPGLAAFGAAFDIVSAPAAAEPELVELFRSHPANFPTPAANLVRIGVERLTDYQDRAYAQLYLDRITAVARADEQVGGEGRGWQLTTAAARHLALWMSYEDVIRVADLKTRASRFPCPDDAAVEHVTEFLHPRFEEVCDTLPSGLGERLFASRRARRWFDRFLARGRFVTTTRLRGFLLLWAVARLRRFRRRTLRFASEQARIGAWLESAVNAARVDYDLGVEIIRLQRLVRGYGDTHARGLASHATIMAQLPTLLGRRDAAALTRELHEAALADEEGVALRRVQQRIAAEAGTPSAGVPTQFMVHA